MDDQSRLLLFTAGTSLFENLRDSKKRVRQPELEESFGNGGADAWHKILRQAEALRSQMAEFARPFASLDLDNADLRVETTAEIASLYLLRKQHRYERDTLVFLCSDTGEGAFCALVNAMLVAQEVRYGVPGPLTDAGLASSSKEGRVAGFRSSELAHGLHDTLTSVRLPCAEIVVVPKLNPTQPKEFEKEALAYLIAVLADRHYHRPCHQRTVLNFTAGFKAAIPILAQTLAMAGGIELVCLYEKAPELMRVPLIPIELSDSCKQRLRSGPMPDKFAELDARDRSLYAGEAGDTEAAKIQGLSTLGIAARTLLLARANWLAKQE